MIKMQFQFLDGHLITFEKFGKIWLAESVIWEETSLTSSLGDLRDLKARVADWFKKCAPKEISDNFSARLPLWEEIKKLPFKDRIACREGRNDQIADYFLGDEDYDRPVSCSVAGSNDYFGALYCKTYRDWQSTGAVRLCLEERK